MNHQMTMKTKTRYFYECAAATCAQTSRSKKTLTKAADAAKRHGWDISGNGDACRPLCPDCYTERDNAIADGKPDPIKYREPVTVPHFYEHETSGYCAMLDEVDRLDPIELRRIVKLTLDCLCGDGDGDATNPRRVTLGRDSAEIVDAIWEDFADLRPTVADSVCPECGSAEAHTAECLDRPPCNECEGQDGHRAGCPNAPKASE